MKMAVVWVVAMMEAAGTSEKYVNFCQTARPKDLDDIHLQIIVMCIL
jgi:hypothetical protein